jgi:uncharacterized membrane protein YvbJ
MVKTATGADDPDDDVTDCPECGAEIYLIADRCPKCGHWFVESDRRKMRANRRNEGSVAEMASEMQIVKIGGVVLLVVLVLCLLVWAVISVVT